MATLDYLRPLIGRVLIDPKTEWSVQGFGMMRTYLGPPGDEKQYRLNIWDGELAIKNVSTIHDHPWHFDSVIIAGMFKNVRYNMVPSEQTSIEPTHDFTVIRTGENGGMSKEPIQSCVLRPMRPEIYGPGNEYSQTSEEVHETIYTDGCVTFNLRRRVGDGEHARVFWPYGTKWVDAKPRKATKKEIDRTVEKALSLF